MKGELCESKKFYPENRLWLFPAAGIFLAVVLCMAYLSSQQPEVGDNPVRNLNADRSLIYVTGENYSLNYEQEQEYQKETQEK